MYACFRVSSLVEEDEEEEIYYVSSTVGTIWFKNLFSLRLPPHQNPRATKTMAKSTHNLLRIYL